MAASLNKVLLMGNLTREPELRYTPGTNSAVCEFGIAINRRFIQNGQEKDETCFLDIVVWGKQAESCSRFLQKGASVFIEGRLVYDTWTEKDTQKKRSRIRVTAERVQFLSQQQSGRRDDGMDAGMVEEDPTASYDAPRPQSYSRPQPQGQPRYQRQQYDAPQQQPRYQQPRPAQAPMPQPPPMPEGDPLEDVDDIPF
ncbi:MAG: single-stranded DNA-binding protein [Lentisphaeria bacterium]|jgi:single-strand DNA-binding protein|nr:single-stranded DNA-binding protein [Lentisphaeria bacterium]